MAAEVTRDDVVAFRLGAHGLVRRSGPEGLLDATARCAVQDSPPGSAAAALHARVDGVTSPRVAEALEADKSLLRTWSMRGAPFLFPTADAVVFTAGVLPPTEEARRRLVLGVGPALDELGLGLDEAVDLTAAGTRQVLRGRRLAIGDLGAEVARRVAPSLTGRQRDLWQAEGPYAPGQPLGEAVVHFCVRVLTLAGEVCFAPRAGGKAPFVLVDEWLGAGVDAADPDLARAELLRRYLRCYGPSTPADFATWVGVAAGDADAWWRLLADELAPVAYRGTSWVLGEDLETLRSAARSAPVPRGVRLLPPRDPYTQARDRDTIVDARYHRDVWRTVGEPGTVLARGRVVGTWRPRKSGRRLTLTVRTFDRLSPRDARTLRDEAERLGPLRDASSVTVDLAT